MRAVTIPMPERTGGVAGFVFPGDRIDLVLTQDVEGGGDGPPLKVSETVVRNLRVLALDQRLDSKDKDGKTIVAKPDLVTLEATPRLAEKIAVAQKIGTLSITLRSIADTTAELERAVASGQIKLPANATPAEERKMLLAIASQPIDTGSTYTTGGDVSRFQRRNVPGREGAAVSASAPASVSPAIAGGAVDSRPAGPTVRVARGNTVSFVPVGAR